MHPNILPEYPAAEHMVCTGFGFQPNAKLSFGLAGIFEYSNFDLGWGSD